MPGPGWRLLIVSMIFLTGLAVRSHLAGMDQRWFQWSLPGVKGLVLYWLGYYEGAAFAYRAHLRDAQQSTGDPEADAIVHGHYRAAQKLARHTLEKNPASVGSLLTLGEVALAEGDIDTALASFNRVVEREPDQFDALLLSSVAYARTHRYHQAIDALSMALRHARVETRVTTFLSALEAIGHLERLPTTERPPCLLAHYLRYLRIFDHSMGRRAIAYAEKAIQAGDRPVDAYVTIGVIRFKQGQVEDALRSLASALELNPRHAEAKSRAAEIYLTRGDLAGGYRMAREAFAAAPGDLFYADRLYDVLVSRLGDYPQALTVANAIQTTRPNDPAAMSRLGHVYQLLGDHAKAIEHYRQAAVLNPHDPTLFEGQGFSLGAVGRIDEAMVVLHRARALGPSRPRSYELLGYLFYWEKRYKEAIAEFERAVALGDWSLQTVAMLCHAHQAALDFHKGQECFLFIRSRMPDEVLPIPSLPEAINNMYVGRQT
jgi:tetratricopeptide (TPR) repeat protein